MVSFLDWILNLALIRFTDHAIGPKCQKANIGHFALCFVAWVPLDQKVLHHSEHFWQRGENVFIGAKKSSKFCRFSAERKVNNFSLMSLI